MKIKLTESDLSRIVRRVLNEQPDSMYPTQPNTGPQRCNSNLYKDFDRFMKNTPNPTLKFVKRDSGRNMFLVSADSVEPCWIKFNELNLSNGKFTLVKQ